MKKIFVVALLAIILAVYIAVQPAHAQGDNIDVFIDNLPVSFNDVEPIIQDGRTLVPFRPIAEALNVEVNWDSGSQTINALGEGVQVELVIGSETALLNQAPTQLEVGPQIIAGRTLVPLRFFSSAFGCAVEWIELSREIKIFTPPTKMAVIGFYALGDSRTSSWTNLFGLPYPDATRGNTDIVGTIALGWYSLDKDGNLLTESRTGWKRPEGWEDILSAAKKYTLQTEMVIHITDADNTISCLLSSGDAMTRAIEATIGVAGLYGGVNLDFEGLGLSQSGEELEAVQQKYTLFVSMLAEKLRKLGKSLTLTVHPPNSEYKGYDYGKLAMAADRIIIMAYDFGPKPEPINLVLEAVEMAMVDVPAEKIILGISIPYETEKSIIPKVGLAKRYKLGGIALWRLGLISNETWSMLRSLIQAR
ncbi:MAG: stalk domain-containing protein [Dethiobacteria bacterium]|jgi:hypothetical protein